MFELRTQAFIVVPLGNRRNDGKNQLDMAVVERIDQLHETLGMLEMTPHGGYTERKGMVLGVSRGRRG